MVVGIYGSDGCISCNILPVSFIDEIINQFRFNNIILLKNLESDETSLLINNDFCFPPDLVKQNAGTRHRFITQTG